MTLIAECAGGGQEPCCNELQSCELNRFIMNVNSEKGWLQRRKVVYFHLEGKVFKFGKLVVSVLLLPNHINENFEIVKKKSKRQFSIYFLL